MTTNEPVRGTLEGEPRGEWDEDGFHLLLETDEHDIDVRVRDVEAARALLAAVADLRGWVDEHDREKAAYEAASPEERRAVLGLPEPESWGDLTWDESAELMRDDADHSRKAEKENR